METTGIWLNGVWVGEQEARLEAAKQRYLARLGLTIHRVGPNEFHVTHTTRETWGVDDIYEDFGVSTRRDRYIL